MQQDILYLLRFLIALLVLGVAVLPFSIRLFDVYKDRGYIFSKSMGLLLGGYLMWLFSSCRIFAFSTIWSVICVVLVAVINYTYVVVCHIKGDRFFTNIIKSSWKRFLASEIAFTTLFILFNWIFAHRVQGFATERMMDLGFMMSLSKTDLMPPKDMWSSDGFLNYYYFGQYLFTYMHKISGLSVGYAYTFGLYSIMAWMAVAIYRMVEAITGSKLAGCISSAVTTVGGNLHYIIYKYLVTIGREILNLGPDSDSYWFADSTRYIGYRPDVEADKTIHEFPMYSFIIGDLHAHVVDILVVILIVALLWSFMCIKKEKNEKDIKVAFSPIFFVIGFLLSICTMTNYWDFPIYLVVSVAIIFFGYVYSYGFGKKTWIYTTFDMMLIFFMSLLFSLPFNLKFEKMVSGVAFASTHSKLYQLFVLWGFPFILLISFIVMVLRDKSIDKRRLFIVLLGLCAGGLVIMTECIFVKDIYINGYPRANTMFKLTYQAFILFGIIMGCIIHEFYIRSKKADDSFSKYRYKKKAIIATAFCVLMVGYCPMALRMWFSDAGGFDYKSMDASYTIKKDASYLMDAIEALETIVDASDNKQPVVLTADGNSYSTACVLSVLTGYPTVLGWHTHEWLWHNSKEYYEDRMYAVRQIYAGDVAQYTKMYLDKYDIDYIFIGPDEYDKYEDVQCELLESFGDVVYSQVCETGQMIEIIKVY